MNDGLYRSVMSLQNDILNEMKLRGDIEKQIESLIADGRYEEAADMLDALRKYVLITQRKHMISKELSEKLSTLEEEKKFLMKRLSDRFLYYCGLISMHRDNPNVKVEDLRHIRNLIELEEQGLLLRNLVGTTVYKIDTLTEEIVDCSVLSMRIGMHGNINYAVETNTRHDQFVFPESEIGKTVFLTQEEAEDTLLEMKEYEG